jgi:hypothetical protein
LPPEALRYPDLESLGAGAARRPDGGGEGARAAGREEGRREGVLSVSSLGGGAWDDWWEGGLDEWLPEGEAGVEAERGAGVAGSGDKDLWRGLLTSAAGAVTTVAEAGETVATLELLRPLQVLCSTLLYSTRSTLLSTLL